MTQDNQNKKEKETKQVAPGVREEEKLDLSGYKSKEEFRIKGTGTPAEEREEEREAARE